MKRNANAFIRPFKRLAAHRS
ncbi:hypothetical protein BQ8794_40066 [Mesorhizobium prunaredense]|uniref:Uncharacterized protein n=1 Tax=Mesorhizobium prunaredense TaxID=1631249 RepID=A0A1R3VDX2_9HYPH|nr:hypothetical protein BQ8794_40066 [Mesorhizobium prunaredense]